MKLVATHVVYTVYPQPTTTEMKESLAKCCLWMRSTKRKSVLFSANNHIPDGALFVITEPPRAFPNEDLKANTGPFSTSPSVVTESLLADKETRLPGSMVKDSTYTVAGGGYRTKHMVSCALDPSC